MEKWGLGSIPFRSLLETFSDICQIVEKQKKIIFTIMRVRIRDRHNLIRSTFLRSDQVFVNLQFDQVFKISDPIKFLKSSPDQFLKISDPINFDLIKFLKSSIRSGFQNLRSDQVRSDQVFKIFDPIRFLKNFRSDQVLKIGLPTPGKNFLLRRANI